MNIRFIKEKNPVNEDYKVNIFIKAIGSGLFTGYIPIASGTFGSIVGVLFFLLPGFEQIGTLFIAVSLSFIAGVFISNIMSKRYGEDPPEVVIDEICGIWFTYLVGLIFFELFFTAKPFNPFEKSPIFFKLLGFSIEITHKRIFAVVGFIIFRFFDILKFPPAKYMDDIKSGYGVMLDDIISGFYAGIISTIITHFLWFRIFIHKIS